MAEPLPVAEALPDAGGAAPYEDDDAQALEDEDERWDAADERWGVGMGIGVGQDGAIVVTELVPGGPAERSAQVASAARRVRAACAAERAEGGADRAGGRDRGGGRGAPRRRVRLPGPRPLRTPPRVHQLPRRPAPVLGRATRRRRHDAAAR